jgi:membrane-bound lytic murein transglycosylase B
MMVRLLAACAAALMPVASAHAAPCGGDFSTFMATLAREAQATGVSHETIDGAFYGITPDPAVLAFDRRQRGTFRKASRNTRRRVSLGAASKPAGSSWRGSGAARRIERQFGVPPRVIVAIWGLESDFGTGDMGGSQSSAWSPRWRTMPSHRSFPA